MSSSDRNKTAAPDLQSAIFIDRDGTMNVDVGYVSRPDQLEMYPWASEAVRLINRAALRAVVVTNQAGVARGLYSEATLERIHDRMIQELERGGARVDAIYYCPHHPELGDPLYRKICDCRKPKPGMLLKAAREHRIDLKRSYVIGDKASDISLASNAGAKSVLVLTGYGRETLENPDQWPCEPDLVADNLLEAVGCILDMTFDQR